MKCASCGQKIETTFLGKLVGTYIKDANGKKHPICFECQRAFTKPQLLERV